MTSTIITKNSSTATSVPATGSLTQGELAVNVTDKRLFTKDSGGTVVEVGTNPSSLTLPNGTANGLAFLNASKVLTSGSALTFDGTNLGIGGTGQLRFATSGGSLGDNWIQTTNSYDLTLYCGRGSTTQMNLSLDYFKFAIGGSEGMRLTSTGLGIGTSSPSQKLHVKGIVNYEAISGSTNVWQQYTYSDNTLRWNYNGSGNDEVVLDSSGNLGLGVTPSSWATVLPVLELKNGVHFGALSTSTPIGYLGANTYYNGTSWIYKVSSNYATRYELNSDGLGKHAWFTAGAGTAGNAITFSQAMTLDASGNLGIGVTSMAQKLQVNGKAIIGSFASTGAYGLYLRSDASSAHYNWQISTQNTVSGAFEIARSDAVGSGTFNSPSMVIDSSGNLLVGTTSSGGAGGFSVTPNSDNGSAQVFFNRSTTTATSYAVIFRNAGSTVGSVSYSNTATAYNTSSDYRLKNTIAPMTGALAKVALLKPCTYKWNADGSDGEGFIAHELAEVVPQCVTGEKDGVNEDGTPKYQGIDTSFLVATLTAAIQELNAKFEAYKATHP